MRPGSLKGQGAIPYCLLLSLQQEGSLQTRTWVLTRSQTASTSGMVFPASRTARNKSRLFKSPSLRLFCSSGLEPFHNHNGSMPCCRLYSSCILQHLQQPLLVQDGRGSVLPRGPSSEQEFSRPSFNLGYEGKCGGLNL